MRLQLGSLGLFFLTQDCSPNKRNHEFYGVEFWFKLVHATSLYLSGGVDAGAIGVTPRRSERPVLKKQVVIFVIKILRQFRRHASSCTKIVTNARLNRGIYQPPRGCHFRKVEFSTFWIRRRLARMADHNKDSGISCDLSKRQGQI